MIITIKLPTLFKKKILHKRIGIGIVYLLYPTDAKGEMKIFSSN